MRRENPSSAASGRPGRLSLGVILCLLLSPVTAPGAGAAPGPGLPELRRWFGAEGGFMEIGCYASESGCLGLSSVLTFGGDLRAVKTMATLEDPDGEERPWPSRTGNRFFRATVPGSSAASAFLTTAGAAEASTSPVTVSFAVRFHTLPIHDVVVFRHGMAPDRSLQLSLGSEGRLTVVGEGVLERSHALTTEDWHTITVTYDGSDSPVSIRKEAAPFTVRVDDQAPIEGLLRTGSPRGPIDLGIVSPTFAPFALGIDDFVEVPSYDASTHGARINYLMPFGQVGVSEWDGWYPYAPCREVAANWQLITEDQVVHTVDPDSGIPTTCGLEGGAVTTEEPGEVDVYRLEGIPSQHKPSGGYARDLSKHPQPGDTVLGVRVRAVGYTSGPTAGATLGIWDAGSVREDAFLFSGTGGGAGAQTRWGATHQLRPTGNPWNAASLGAARLMLVGGPETGVRRWITVARLDYVWVP